MLRNNQVSQIRVPQFANLTMGTVGYKVHITLNITKDVAEYIKRKNFSNVEIFFWNKSWKVRVNKVYLYSTPIAQALYINAYKTLDHLKVLIREAKIANLKTEIETIKADWR